MSRTKSKEPTMAELIKSSEFPVRTVRRGDIVEGKVLLASDQEALVNIGVKAEGVLPKREMEGKKLQVGDRVLVYVVSTEDRKGQIVLSTRRAQSAKSWLELQEALSEEKTLTCEVTGHNKGGVTVEILGTQGFIPFSHFQSGPELGSSRPETQSELDRMRGKTLLVKVIELDEDKDRVILSERQAREEETLRERLRVLEKLELGQKVEVPITAVLPYGLQVAIHFPEGKNSLEGLIPVEELSWEENGAKLASFAVGQKIEAKVIEIDLESGRLRLSIKQLKGDPWEEAVRKFKERSVHKAKVSKITSFGILLALADEIEGLLPLSALPWDRRDLEVGEKLDVVVKHLDQEKRRIELEYGEKSS